MPSLDPSSASPPPSFDSSSVDQDSKKKKYELTENGNLLIGGKTYTIKVIVKGEQVSINDNPETLTKIMDLYMQIAEDNKYIIGSENLPKLTISTSDNTAKMKGVSPGKSNEVQKHTVTLEGESLKHAQEIQKVALEALNITPTTSDVKTDPSETVKDVAVKIFLESESTPDSGPESPSETTSPSEMYTEQDIILAKLEQPEITPKTSITDTERPSEQPSPTSEQGFNTPRSPKNRRKSLSDLNVTPQKDNTDHSSAGILFKTGDEQVTESNDNDEVPKEPNLTSLKPETLPQKEIADKPITPDKSKKHFENSGSKPAVSAKDPSKIESTEAQPTSKSASSVIARSGASIKSIFQKIFSAKEKAPVTSNTTNTISEKVAKNSDTINQVLDNPRTPKLLRWNAERKLNTQLPKLTAACINLVGEEASPDLETTLKTLFTAKHTLNRAKGSSQEEQTTALVGTTLQMYHAATTSKTKAAVMIALYDSLSQNTDLQLQAAAVTNALITNQQTVRATTAEEFREALHAGIENLADTDFRNQVSLVIQLPTFKEACTNLAKEEEKFTDDHNSQLTQKFNTVLTITHTLSRAEGKDPANQATALVDTTLELYRDATTIEAKTAVITSLCEFLADDGNKDIRADVANKLMEYRESLADDERVLEEFDTALAAGLDTHEAIIKFKTKERNPLLDAFLFKPNSSELRPRIDNLAKKLMLLEAGKIAQGKAKIETYYRGKSASSTMCFNGLGPALAGVDFMEILVPSDEVRRDIAASLPGKTGDLIPDDSELPQKLTTWMRDSSEKLLNQLKTKRELLELLKEVNKALPEKLAAELSKEKEGTFPTNPAVANMFLLMLNPPVMNKAVEFDRDTPDQRAMLLIQKSIQNVGNGVKFSSGGKDEWMKPLGCIYDDPTIKDNMINIAELLS
ncbi:hypothetical protein SCG7086_BQ_00020 [Chlamydiales bacterium SCGC AG-110-P3]|nr:hypothetical protein SCG7086_BQ_00020 [Chlamydiales bacterium SCGC AG-110-P3]